MSVRFYESYQIGTDLTAPSSAMSDIIYVSLSILIPVIDFWGVVTSFPPLLLNPKLMAPLSMAEVRLDTRCAFVGEIRVLGFELPSLTVLRRERNQRAVIALVKEYSK